jgi:AcrR family transcriptional regulator
VARRAQVSVGLAYHHFGSKAGLIASVVEAFYTRLDSEVFGAPRWPAATWAERERGRIAAYFGFHFHHPFAPLVIGPLSRSPEVLDVESGFTTRTLAAGARMLEAAQQNGEVPADIDPELTIALMSGGIRQALLGALSRDPRPDPTGLTNTIWAFMAAALRLTADAGSVSAAPCPPA